MRRDFVANVSHEIRTPLTVLIGFLETMQSIELSAEQRNRYLALMMTQSSRMKSLDEDLLTLANLEVNAAFAPRQEFDLIAEMAGLKIDAEALSAGRHRLVFEILTDAQLNALNINANQTINNVLRNFTPSIHNNTNPYVSGFVDLFPIRNLYLTCSGLGNFNTMSVSGDRSIVKKIPVNAGYGEFVFDQSVVGIDYLDCSHQTLSRIGFQLKDVFGHVVNLHGNHVSFSIVFSRIQEIQ
jgi:signal transduction histidine kinase